MHDLLHPPPTRLTCLISLSYVSNILAMMLQGNCSRGISAYQHGYVGVAANLGVLRMSNMVRLNYSRISTVQSCVAVAWSTHHAVYICDILLTITKSFAKSKTSLVCIDNTSCNRLLCGRQRLSVEKTVVNGLIRFFDSEIAESTFSLIKQINNCKSLMPCTNVICCINEGHVKHHGVALIVCLSPAY